MLKSLVSLARARHWSMFLEATSTRSRDLFSSVGFQVVEELNLGKGVVNEHGMKQSDGCGVSVWFAVLPSSVAITLI